MQRQKDTLALIGKAPLPLPFPLSLPLSLSLSLFLYMQLKVSHTQQPVLFVLASHIPGFSLMLLIKFAT